MAWGLTTAAMWFLEQRREIALENKELLLNGNFAGVLLKHIEAKGNQ